MATKYSRRQVDGSVEYYDSREEMLAANPSGSFGETLIGISRIFNPFLAAYGFMAAGVLAVLVLAFSEYFGSWPTWAKFTAALAVAIVCGYLSGKFGHLIIMVSAALFVVGAVVGAGSLAWYLLSLS